jgi:ABC-type nitrate/sulfonate/bicarbonate transport system permease component
MAGVRAVEPILVEAGRSFGARGVDMFRHVLLPGALPYIFNGLRLGCGTALLVVVAAEFVAADSGIGYMVWNSWTMLVTEKMYVGFVIISLIGLISAWLIEQCRRLVMPWEAGRRAKGRAPAPAVQSEI